MSLPPRAERARVWLSVAADPLLPRAFRERFAQDNAQPVPQLSGCLSDAVFAAGEGDPEAAAVIFPGGTWSYRELCGCAEALAADLWEAGVGRGDVVALALQKGPWQVAATIAVLRAGAAFVPLDAEHPPERLAGLVSSLAPRAAVVAPADREAGWLCGTRAFSVPDPARARTARRSPGRAGPADLAYVMHTSGSTGRPKGVMIARGAAFATIAAVNARLGLTSSDRVLSVSAATFDLSVWDVLGPLSVGAAVVTPDAGGARDPAAWLALARAAGATIWNSAPGLMGAALERGGSGLEGLRWALLSGDFIPLSMPDAIRAVARGCRVLSLGGATEAAIWSVWREVEAVDPAWRSIPYGRALPGQSALVVDARLSLCPPFAEGEIVIGGAGLAEGYWNDPEETARRFVVHPVTGARLYRTGDRGRARPDGEIEILGRMEDSVAESPAPSSSLAPSTVSAAAFAAAIVRTSAAFLAETLGLAEVLPQDRLLALGADSMTMLQLASEIEARHGVAVEVAALFSNPSIETLAATLSTRNHAST